MGACLPRARLLRGVLLVAADLPLPHAPRLRLLSDGDKALHFSSSVEPFLIYLKVALYAGLFLAAPFILWQLWAFVAPGLYRREKRGLLPFVVAATLFFFSGAAFCYLVILPPAFEFLIGSAGPDIQPV